MLGENGECEVRGVVSVKIRKFVNNEWTSSTIENVLYVPKLRKNLFSVKMCAARGFDVTFSENRVVISRRGEIIAEGAKQANAIYRMFFAVLPVHGDCATEINVSESLADLKLWHERFSHAGKNTLKKISASGFVNGVKVTDAKEIFCEPCQFGKAHRLPFQKCVQRKRKYKARLCARGFRQVEGLHYKETFAPVIRYDSFCIFLVLVTHLDLELVQFDIETAFLYGDLQEEIWDLSSGKCIFRGCVNDVAVIVALFVDDGLVAVK